MQQREEIVAALESAYFSDNPDEEDVLQHLPRLLRGVRHFVDIGASLGQYTFRANKILTNARIDAIEAEPLRFERLRENCTAWAADGPNRISVRHLAIGSRSGPIDFFSTQSNVSGGLFTHPMDHLDAEMAARVNWKKMSVDGGTLDELYGDAPPDFIKMDIEGAEWDALQGATRLLRERRTSWLIELHHFGQANKPAQVVALMRSHGYAANEIAPGRVLFRPMTPRLRLIQIAKGIARRLRSVRKRLT